MPKRFATIFWAFTSFVSFATNHVSLLITSRLRGTPAAFDPLRLVSENFI
jgi:hypothetical protein